MQSNNLTVDELPELDFIEGRTLEQTRDEMISDYEDYMTQETGKVTKLHRANPFRAIIYACTMLIYQVLAYIDRAAKRNTVKYSYSKWLDHLGALKGVTRISASAATTTLQFTLSAKRESATGIPKGTRVSTRDQVYFATSEYAEVPAGSTSVTVGAECIETGTSGNQVNLGELNIIVDPVPYVASVTNTTVPEGGADTETDAAFKERILIAPSKYAPGTHDGYYYRAKEYSAAIGDIAITSTQNAGKVDIVFLKTDGSAPSTELCSGLQEYLRTDEGHIMNDLVNCAAPEEVEYEICFTYYIRSSDSARAESIQTAVNAAVTQYQSEQREIGKDIVPDDLIQKVKAAGAKRLNITDSSFAPVYTAVPANKVAALSGIVKVTYGGLEDG